MQDIKSALTQKNLKNENDFMLYFDEQMNKLVSQGDIYQQKIKSGKSTKFHTSHHDVNDIKGHQLNLLY